MAEDWLADVRKYVPEASETVVAGIIRYCGIALRTRDASLVSFSDPKETGRVRENFLKKKLGLTDDDATLDRAIATVGDRMKGDHFKNRVTVYYLLAQHFGKLGLFGTDAEIAAASGDAVSGAGATVTGIGAAATAAGASTAAYAPEAFTTRPGTTPPDGGSIFTKWWLWLLLLVLALILLFLLLRSCNSMPLQTAATNMSASESASVNEVAPTNMSDAEIDNATAPVANSAIDTGNQTTGARVVAETRDGKPMLTVYFDTAKYDVPADFADKAGDIKAYVAGHPGAKLAVSGFNDPTGNAAFNAQLSKHRAQAVGAALDTIGIAKGSVTMEKPTDATISTTDNSAARRVEVTIK